MEMSEDIKNLVDRLFQEGESWERLIKDIREALRVGIVEAQRIALQHKGWRRLCNYRINHERQCRKQALSHIKQHGPDAFVAAHGNILLVVEEKLGKDAATSEIS